MIMIWGSFTTELRHDGQPATTGWSLNGQLSTGCIVNINDSPGTRHSWILPMHFDPTVHEQSACASLRAKLKSNLFSHFRKDRLLCNAKSWTLIWEKCWAGESFDNLSTLQFCNLRRFSKRLRGRQSEILEGGDGAKVEAAVNWVKVQHIVQKWKSLKVQNIFQTWKSLKV